MVQGEKSDDLDRIDDELDEETGDVLDEDTREDDEVLACVVVGSVTGTSCAVTERSSGMEVGALNDDDRGET